MVVGAVELMRVASLVLVAARFDTTDEALLSSELFPLCYSTVELWPALSIHPDPIAELGASVAPFVVRTVGASLKEWEEKRSAVAQAMADLAASPDDLEGSGC